MYVCVLDHLSFVQDFQKCGRRWLGSATDLYTAIISLFSVNRMLGFLNRVTIRYIYL